MAHDVFLSYSNQNKPIADACCAGLESAGVRCWIAPRDVLPATEYGAAIIDAIERSRAMVLVFSSHANGSPHIRREVERALSKGKVIVPFRIEPITPTGALEYALSGIHWLDALTPPVESKIGELVSVVKRVLAPGTRDTPDITTTSSPTGPSTKTESGSTDPELPSLRREISNRIKSYIAELRRFIGRRHGMQIYSRFYERLYCDPTDQRFFYLSRPGGDPRFARMSLEYLLQELLEKTSDAAGRDAVNRALRFIAAARSSDYDDRLDEDVIIEFSAAFEALTEMR